MSIALQLIWNGWMKVISSQHSLMLAKILHNSGNFITVSFSHKNESNEPRQNTALMQILILLFQVFTLVWSGITSCWHTYLCLDIPIKSKIKWQSTEIWNKYRKSGCCRSTLQVVELVFHPTQTCEHVQKFCNRRNWKKKK